MKMMEMSDVGAGPANKSSTVRVSMSQDGAEAEVKLGAAISTNRDSHQMNSGSRISTS